MKKRAHVIVEGDVQGVYYRATAAEVADKHNVSGWVKNKQDGTVEAVLEGEEADVLKVLEWCRIGPERARVDNVIVTWEEFQGEFDEFKSMTRFNTY
ncbi:MAG: acylphosphatase [Deltaproteobacteria bacterium]|nr:acylphosphatase [Deltaproteobacteria bacterium]